MATTGEKDPKLVLSTGGEEEDDEEIDETLAERLIGLTEMFPKPLRNFSSSVLDLTQRAIKTSYSYGRSGMWVLASSATILVLPLMFEIERSQMEEQQLQQQRQILLGPNAAVSGQAQGPGMAGVPGMMPLPPPPGQAR
ncbi:mitochondrial import receptor subunit TOM22 homolog [Lineus longissimus]|uniref:mitochondrial import receptor subunit TOM22 homolog n=1 Tax=Lineus longissimus TaxID=88925 RepID=UPI002B4D540F